MKNYRFNNVKDFDPEHIFDCGQCFRWRLLPDGSWTGIVGASAGKVTAGSSGARIANVSFLTGTGASDWGTVKVIQYNATGSSNKEACAGAAGSGKDRDFWYNYLDLGRDYGAIKKELTKVKKSRNNVGQKSGNIIVKKSGGGSGDARGMTPEQMDVMKRAIKSGSGIRILNQDLWETIVSFIISQNNNIPRIKGCIENLARVAGEPITCNAGEQLKSELAELGLVPYTIPSPEKLASMTVEDLAPVRLGYRAKYLIAAAQEVLDRGLPTNYDELLALTGVGPKVANCIGLFGLHDEASFPIDVWVRRVMHDLYGFPEGDTRAMQEFASENFGPLSGFAQQYLFYYIRK